MNKRKIICAACAALMLLPSCARLKEAKDKAVSAVGSVKSEISSVIEKAETEKDSGDTEGFDPFKIYYDESEPEIHYYGKAPEHFALTEKYFNDEPEEEPVDYYMAQDYSCFDIYDFCLLCAARKQRYTADYDKQNRYDYLER